jgi:hypothetical protein
VAADTNAESCFVDQADVRHSRLVCDYGVAGQAMGDPELNIQAGPGRYEEVEECPSMVLGLEEARDVRCLESTQARGVVLQLRHVQEVRRDLAPILVPPALRTSARHLDQGVNQLRVVALEMLASRRSRSPLPNRPDSMLEIIVRSAPSRSATTGADMPAASRGLNGAQRRIGAGGR